ncbi:MAG: hypothetical protein AB1665_02830, partial [Candidatus Thermoplasmatota archaeon]
MKDRRAMTDERRERSGGEPLADPSGLKSEEEIVNAYFAACRQSYLRWPGNEKEKAYLDNNRELFRISSYFDVPREPSAVLAGWGLPENLRGHIHLDEGRKEVVGHVLGTPPDRNVAIIGDPGVGKTAVMLAILDEAMRLGIAGILTTTGLSEYHRKARVRLFYDDLPENPELAKAIERSSATGIIITAREQDFKCRLSQAQQAMFERVYVRSFAPDDVREVARNLLEMQGMSSDAEAMDLLVEYAQGSPIYVWSVVRDLTNRGERRLNADYLKENASRGMIPYVSQVMQRLMKDGERFKPGGLHTLTMLVFLATQMRDRRCHSLHLRKVSGLMNEHTVRTFEETEGAYNVGLQTHTLEYLSGKGNVYRFPHDCWADILSGAVASPFSARVDLIQQEFEMTGIFESVKLKALVAGWADVRGMYQKRPDRFRNSLLDYVHIALRNHSPKDLDAAGMQTEQLRLILAREHGHPLADASLSIIERSSPSSQRTINIQDSVIMRSQIGLEADAEMRDSIAPGTGPGAPAAGARAAKDRCQSCGNLITAENKILRCRECGADLCTTCEEWIEKTPEYKGREIKTRFPLCEKCHAKESAEKVAEVERQLDEERKAREAEEEARKKAEAERRE